jgi:hypothetical protein
MAALTLIEILKSVSDPLRAGVIEQLYLEEPLFQYIPWQPVMGLSFSYNQETTLPGVAFRQLNAAYTPTVGVINRKTEALMPFGGDSDCDVAFVKAYGAGRREQYDRMFTKAMAIKYVQTFLYGNSGARTANAYDDADGFDGMMARLTGNQVIDNGGTAGSGGSSVFAIRFGDGFVTGLQTPDGVDVRDLGEIDDKPVYRTRIEQIGGMAIESGTAAATIQDIDSGATLGVAKMDQLVDAISGDPTVIVMSKRSRRELTAACRSAGIVLNTVYDAVGRPIQAWGVIPIITSDAVIDTEVTS